MSQNIRQHQLREAQRNGEALAYTPNGPMTQDEFRRSQNNLGPQNNADNEP